MDSAQRDDFRPIVEPILTVGPSFRRWSLALGAVVLWAIGAWTWQLFHGLGVTNLGRPVYWGLYITNFVFFIGVSHAGTLISAILRIVNAEWRRPITRMAEVITVLVLFFGVGNVLLDLGRPDRAWNVLRHPHFSSPLLWDVSSISVYLTCSTIYLYLPLIPDIARLRDRTTGWRHALYTRLAIGWTGAPHQWHRLERAIGVMAILVIPVAVSVHTVVSWVFGMTIQPMWHSSIFGPYFVVGAIFSGIAAIIVAMAIVRKVYKLEAYLQPVHFNNLGLLLLVFSCLWFYFTFAEHLTAWYAQEPDEIAVLNAKVFGRFAPLFWSMFVSCFVVPFAILANNRTRTIAGTVVASISVNIGMWLERFTIVVPSLSNPRAPVHTFVYAPSWVEWSLMAGCFAAFTLLYMGFTKLFPIISIWELEAEAAVTPQTVAAPAPALSPTGAVTAGGTICLLLALALPTFAIEAGAQPAAHPPRAVPSVRLAVTLPENPSAGARVFVEKGCSRCHALGGEGRRMGPDLGRIRLPGSILDLAGAFWNHAPVMREKMLDLKIARPQFEDSEMADLLAFLTAYRYYLAEVGAAGNPAVGREVFRQKRCSSCHGDRDAWNLPGPSLERYRGHVSPIVLAQAMWNHGTEMAAIMRQKGFAFPQFSGRELGDLLAFLQAGTTAADERVYVEPGSPRRGRELFAAKRCVSCHTIAGVGGRGGPDLGAPEREMMRPVTAIAGSMWNHSQGMAVEFVRRGIPAVRFSGQEMADIIAYLYFVNYAGVSGRPSAGQQVFSSRCAACHTLGSAGVIGPDLRASPRLDDPIAIFTAMWNHAPRMEQEMQRAGVAWPRLAPGDGADLTAFLIAQRSADRSAR